MLSYLETGMFLERLRRVPLPDRSTQSKTRHLADFPLARQGWCLTLTLPDARRHPSPQATASLPLLPSYFWHGPVSDKLARVASSCMERPSSVADWQTFCDSRRATSLSRTLLRGLYHLFLSTFSCTELFSSSSICVFFQ